MDAAVRARFVVKDTYLLQEGAVEYKVEYSSDTKRKFADFCGAIAPSGLTPWLTGSREDCTLTVRKTVTPVRKKSRIPVILTLLALSTVLLFSVVEELGAQQLAPGFPPYVASIGSGATLAAVIGARFLAGKSMAKSRGEEMNTQYLLPGLPGVTSILPTLGFISYQSRAALNRDRYFDVMLVGPVAAFSAAVLLQFAGDITAVQTSAQLSTCLTIYGLFQACPINPSMIQLAIAFALGPFVPSLSSGHSVVSPIGDGATVGLVLVFVALLPMSSFDGGHVSNLIWGPRGARVATYLCVLVLLALDATQTLYWGVAIAVLLIGGRPLSLSFQDDVSEVSAWRRSMYLGLLLAAFLVIPIPHDIATVPLG